MPVYQYECGKGHYFERTCSVAERKERMRCKVKRCKKIASQVIRPNYFVPANRFDPVVIHRDAQGNIRYPGNVNAPVPKGFEKVELKTIADVRNFERHVNDKELSNWRRRQEEKEQERNIRMEGNRSDLRTLMQSMSPHGRDLAEYAMKKNDSRPRPKYDPGFFVEAFSIDKSNREPHNDVSTDWKRKY